MKQLANKNMILAFFLLYIVSIFISKFGISFFGGVIALCSIYIFIKKDFLKDFKLPFTLMLLGIIFQTLSLGGFKSSGIFFYKNYYLLILPFSLYFFENIEKKYIVNTISIALFLGILKSFYNFYKYFALQYSESIRVDSFFDIGRWGIVLVMGLLFLLVNLKRDSIFYWIVFVSGIISLGLNNSRAPILSFILGIIFYLIYTKKIKIILIGAVLSAFIIYSSSNIPVLGRFEKRMQTVQETKTGGNAARLFMWEKNIKFFVNSFENNKKLFFFGTGIDNREKIFKDYLINDKDYNKLSSETKISVSFRDAHNAYLNMLVQTGIVFTILYYLLLFYYSLKLTIKLFREKDLYSLGSFLVLGAFLFTGIFYGYSFTYETFTFFFLFSVGLIKNKELF
ncbi:O-antigen ligase family protein [Fusobacterium massiliense]|uniref:O-antigen ligase family protein n=1 Tax=Fusobacterium massiliense TaxID=1852365 RepID=UPI0028E51F19|nr:O-antigen ligase family protein [Fusobacterium massiliense]